MPGAVVHPHQHDRMRQRPRSGAAGVRRRASSTLQPVSGRAGNSRTAPATGSWPPGGAKRCSVPSSGRGCGSDAAGPRSVRVLWATATSVECTCGGSTTRAATMLAVSISTARASSPSATSSRAQRSRSSSTRPASASSRSCVVPRDVESSTWLPPLEPAAPLMRRPALRWIATAAWNR
ncbi:hypothetical protein BJF90_12835 [Pseudonocardia sp. CNS-004]|nr:hypothetical protein BJF90_12835 [Pseudonocardia sp. CNS-004]